MVIEALIEGHVLVVTNLLVNKRFEHQYKSCYSFACISMVMNQTLLIPWVGMKHRRALLQWPIFMYFNTEYIQLGDFGLHGLELVTRTSTMITATTMMKRATATRTTPVTTTMTITTMIMMMTTTTAAATTWLHS